MSWRIRSSTHIFPDELGDGAGQHEAGDGAAHDVEEGVHDPRAGGGFDRRTEGTAERAGCRSTATAYLRRRGRRRLSIHPNTTHSLTIQQETHLFFFGG